MRPDEKKLTLFRKEAPEKRICTSLEVYVLPQEERLLQKPTSNILHVSGSDYSKQRSLRGFLFACLLARVVLENKPSGFVFSGKALRHQTKPSAAKSYFCLLISEADSLYLAKDGPPPSSYLCLPSTGIRSMSTMAGFQRSYF